MDKVVLVADMAMFNDKNLQMMETNGIQYVVAARLKSLPRKKRESVLTRNFKPSVVAGEFQWIREFEHKQRRLIVSYSQKRARKNRADRL